MATPVQQSEQRAECLTPVQNWTMRLLLVCHPSDSYGSAWSLTSSNLVLLSAQQFDDFDQEIAMVGIAVRLLPDFLHFVVFEL